MSERRHIRHAALIATVVLLAGLPAASAFAQGSADDPSSAQYDAPLSDEASGDTGGAADSGGEGSGLEANIAFLPFTGLDLLIAAGVALVLTGTGFALRRAARDQAG